jgi:CheY-like chemotaxis protein
LRAIGHLAGGIAHDFNNQLTGIIGFADILRHELKGKDGLERYAENILIAARHSSEITNQLLLFARKGKYATEKTDIHHVLSEVVSILSHSLDKGIRIEQILNAHNSFVEGDPSLLHNAFLNLAINSRDAMPGGGTITFKTENVELSSRFCDQNGEEVAPGKYIEICVADTGAGMSEEVKNRLFEPFFTTKGAGKGTGMGLAAVSGTVNEHNGAIKVISRSGEGTTFKIFLPLASKQAEQQKDSNAKPDMIKKNLNVLLVDDELIICRLGKEIFDRIGFRSDCCSNGREAVELYKKSTSEFDLVILDMIMPEMNGKDTFYALKDINKDIKVLLSSGYCKNGDIEELLRNGACGFLQKPFTVEKLKKSISEIFPESSY